jgi:hypothetical protein
MLSHFPKIDYALMHMQDEEEELDRLYSILYNLLIEPVEKYLERIPSDYNLVIIPHEVK